MSGHANDACQISMDANLFRERESATQRKEEAVLAAGHGGACVLTSRTAPSPLARPEHHATKRASTPCTQAQMREENQELDDELLEEDPPLRFPILEKSAGRPMSLSLSLSGRKDQEHLYRPADLSGPWGGGGFLFTLVGEGRWGPGPRFSSDTRRRVKALLHALYLCTYVNADKHFYPFAPSSGKVEQAGRQRLWMGLTHDYNVRQTEVSALSFAAFPIGICRGEGEKARQASFI